MWLKLLAAVLLVLGFIQLTEGKHRRNQLWGGPHVWERGCGGSDTCDGFGGLDICTILGKFSSFSCPDGQYLVRLCAAQGVSR